MARFVSIDDVLMRAGLDKTLLENMDESGPDYFYQTVDVGGTNLAQVYITCAAPQFAKRFTKLDIDDQTRVCEALTALVPEAGDSMVIKDSNSTGRKPVRVTRTKQSSRLIIHLLLTP